MDYIESFGAILSPKDVRDYRGVCAVSEDAFPEEFELAMPKVKSQGQVGSCVAHSLASTIEYFNSVQGDSTDEISPGFIYGNRAEKDYTGIGLVVSQALNRVTKCGSVSTTLFNDHVEVPEMQNIVKSRIMELLPEAFPNRITSYFRLYDDAAIKASLMQNGPVVFAMTWFEDIKLVRGVINTAGKRGNSAHAMVIYGWDKTGWKIQNSWGTSWGNGGRAILPYSVPRSETWGIIDTYSEATKNKKIDDLMLTLETLNKALDETDKNLNMLEQALEDSKSDLDKKDTDYQNLQLQYRRLEKEYASQVKKITEYEQQINVLNQKLIDVEKPYRSAVGQIVAKLLNFILNAVQLKINK